jgi:hypothetical protein
MQPYEIGLEAAGENGSFAATALALEIARPGVTREVIRSSGIVGILCLPLGAGPHPSAIVLNGAA